MPRKKSIDITPSQRDALQALFYYQARNVPPDGS